MSLIKKLLLVAGALVVIAIGLAAVSAPAIMASREAARRSLCMNNLKMIGMALANYHQVYRTFPPAYVADEDGKPMHSWRVLVLPFLGEPEGDLVYKSYRFDEPWNSEHNRALAEKMPSIFMCPSDKSESSNTNYLAVVGEETVWPGATPVGFRGVRDGPGNTILLVETVGAGVHWLEPRDLSASEVEQGLHSGHAGGNNALFADSHVQFLPNDIPPAVLRAMLTREGGETVDVSAW
jgi:prepilin-type processing-associated H-X9-DG protein